MYNEVYRTIVEIRMKKDRIMRLCQSIAGQLLTILGVGLVAIGLLISSTLITMNEQKMDNSFVSFTLKVEREIDGIQRLVINDHNNGEPTDKNLLSSLQRSFEAYREKIALDAIYANDILLTTNLSAIETKFKSIDTLLNDDGDQVISSDDFSVITTEMMLMKDLLEENKGIFVQRVRQTTNLVSKKINTIGIALATLILLLSGFIVKQLILPLRKITKSFKEHAEEYKTEEITYSSTNELGVIVEHYNQVSSQINSLQDMNVKINEFIDFHEVIEFVYKNFKRFMPYNRIGVSILIEGGRKVRAIDLMTDGKVELGSNYTIPIEGTSLGKLMQSKEVRIINDLEAYSSSRPESESTRKILQEGIQSSLTLPLYVSDKCIGFLFFSSTEKNVYNQSHVGFIKMMADPLANSIQKSFIHEDLILTTINGFAKLVEERDADTGDHLERMKAYCELVAKIALEEPMCKNEINEQLLFTVARHSVLHDIGKIGIPDAILLKNGRLTAEEFEVIKTHPVIGARTLEEMSRNAGQQENNIFNDAIDIVKYHHEKFDGTGYPEGLKGKEIPMVARIVAIGDVFDALSSKRVYKDKFGFEASFEILIESSGTHFDPDLIELVVKHKDDFYQLYEKFHRNV